MVTIVAQCVCGEGDEFGNTCRTSGRMGSEGSREATRRLPRSVFLGPLWGKHPDLGLRASRSSPGGAAPQ